MVDPFLALCFWSYPKADPAVPLPAGKPLNVEVVIPPATSTFPVTGATVDWTLTDKDTGTTLRPGVDYQLLAGGLQSRTLSIVFKPTAREVTVAPRVRLFYCDGLSQAKVADSDDINNPAPQFAKQTYTLAGIAATDRARVIAAISGALSLVADKTIVPPGEPALLKVLPRSTSDVPQIVTSVLDEAPKVEVRGAIPLKGLVEAIVGPLTRGLGRALPGSRASLEDAGDDVVRLLGQPLAIPLAIDVLGKRVTKALAPLGEPQVPLFTSTPPETSAIQGLVPVGKWQSPFKISVLEWDFVQPLPPHPKQKRRAVVAKDLSPGLGFVKSFLLKPKLVSLAVGGAATSSPSIVTVTARLNLEVEPSVFGEPTEIVLSLPLQVLTLAVPRVAAVFRFSRRLSGQRAYVCPDPATATFMSSVDDSVRFLSRLGTVLNNVVAVAHLLAPDELSDWREILDLAMACGLLTDKLGRTDPDRIFFIPAWRYNEKIRIKKNIISTVIYIGRPGHVWFELRGGQGGTDFITMRRTSVLPDLKGRFEDVVQLPPGSVEATSTHKKYDNRLEVLVFRTDTETPVIDDPVIPPDLGPSAGHAVTRRRRRSRARGHR
jgi:hypothetical protein